jgi:hypothetical protein
MHSNRTANDELPVQSRLAGFHCFCRKCQLSDEAFKLVRGAATPSLFRETRFSVIERDSTQQEGLVRARFKPTRL